MRFHASASFVMALLAATTLSNIPVLARDAVEAVPQQQWAFQSSDIKPDAGFRFGQLANGLRYILRHNATPAGTAVVRMDVAAGSLDERDNERGYAHFVEHMAFNGSTRVAEGEMVRLLERHGLAFGADTNASTSFDRTQYKLDLPKADPTLLDTALMLMRETASELTISAEAVARERGVILSEMRDRNTWQLRDTIANTQFFYPNSRFAERFPIGVPETLQAATSDTLRAFYNREYVPSKTSLVVIGDFDADAVEKLIKTHFESWQAAKPTSQPSAGPINAKDKSRVAIYIDPAVSERVALVRNGPWLNEPDSVAQRREAILRQIGYSIVNRRLLRIARQENAPFRGAGFGTGDVFQAGRSTRLIIDTVDGKWRDGLVAATLEYRRALAWGFTQAEVAEQVAALKTNIENAAAAQNTRSNGALAAAALALITDKLTPSAPADALARFQAFAPLINPDAVMAAMQREALTLQKPLIRFRGRSEPNGGPKALLSAWKEANRAKVEQTSTTDDTTFAYTNFGQTGMVVLDSLEPNLGIRQVRFANGTMLNIKRTDLEQDRVRVSMAIDGGGRIATKENPLANEMIAYLGEGGLGKHSADSLQTILAGRSVSLNVSSSDDAFVANAITTPRDLELQLQLWSAILTDPGFRTEGQIQYRQSVNNAFKQLRATPASALRAEQERILSDGDPRFSLQDVEAYRRLTFAKLKEDISDRLTRGAIEVGIVGDVDEAQAIALVANTLGALPPREAAFPPFDQAPRTFTTNTQPRVVHHTGPADQSVLRLVWPTRDNDDATEAMRLELLERIVRVALTDTLREALGKAYSPSASSAMSPVWKGYGTFSITASIDVKDIPATRAAIQKTLEDLRAKPVSADILQRSRQPLLEGVQNALKSNNGWLGLVRRAQSKSERIDRFTQTKSLLEGITAKDLQDTARRYLQHDTGLEILVLPEGITPPAA